MNIARLAPPVGPVAGRKGACTPRTCGAQARGSGRANAQTPVDFNGEISVSESPEQRLIARRSASRERLAARREQLLQELRRATEQYEKLGLDSFRNRRDGLEQELDKIDSMLMQSDLTGALEADTAAREADRAERENFTFWFRRFMLSLQIGNGGGFLATVAAVQQADPASLSTLAKLLALPVTFFGIGTILAGLLPLIMAAHANERLTKRAQTSAEGIALALTMGAAAFFACGVLTVTWELLQAQRPKAPVEAVDQKTGQSAAHPSHPAKPAPALQTPAR